MSCQQLCKQTHSCNSCNHTWRNSHNALYIIPIVIYTETNKNVKQKWREVTLSHFRTCINTRLFTFVANDVAVRVCGHCVNHIRLYDFWTQFNYSIHACSWLVWDSTECWTGQNRSTGGDVIVLTWYLHCQRLCTFHNCLDICSTFHRSQSHTLMHSRLMCTLLHLS